MLRRYIIFLIVFSLSLNVFAQIVVEDFFLLDSEKHDIKKITERSFSKWDAVLFFGKDGLLLRKVNYYKSKMRADYRYEYFMSDTLLEIKEKEHLNINKNPESHMIYKYYYDSLKQCYRVEIYTSRDLEEPKGRLDNFLYKDNKLQSYERYANNINRVEFITKYVYIYSKNQRIEHRYNVEGDSVSIDDCKSTLIYKNNKLIDLICECDNEKYVFTGVICWSDEKMNKVHIRYSNFDKYGNWKKSYFITEKGKVLRSKRKIKYW